MILEDIWQYLVVGLAIAVLLAVKAIVLQRRVTKQSEAYVDPGLCLEHLSKQIERVDLAEKMLDNYVLNSQNSADRFRNIALLVAFINSKQKESKANRPLSALLKATADMKGISGQYRSYIANNTASWA